MGMSASQGRYFFLTNRSNNIGYTLTRLSNDKMELTRDMQRVSKTYQDALSKKTLKWTNNSGVSYINLSYANLMRPSLMNQNKPYLLSDSAGRIVIDNQYKKYAEMISANGNSGGDWESVRSQVLGDLLGVSPSEIDRISTYDKDISESKAILEESKSKEPSRRDFDSNSLTNLLNKMGKYGSISSWGTSYTGASKISLGKSANEAKSIFDEVVNLISEELSPYFLEGEDMFKTACQKIIDMFPQSTFDNKDAEKNNGGCVSINDNDEYKLNIRGIVDQIIGAYIAEGGKTNVAGKEESTGDTTSCVWYDIDSDKYRDYQKEYPAWEKEYNLALENYNNACNARAQALTAEQESLINFYDNIFSTIAEKGWINNNYASDDEYLNQMLQNNTYTITTTDSKRKYDNKTGSFVYNNNYETDIATNFTYIATVNDHEAKEEALAVYEYEKAIINRKESQIDTRMQDLQTEQAAIKQMLEGLQKVIGENIDNNLNIFG